jgi:glycosyltransferase involved in cell wall biosynthesis
VLEIGEDDVVFLLFGWIRRYKGVLELIRAFKDLRAHGTRLVIAGRPSGEGLEDEIRTAAADDPRILLHLHTIPDDEVQVFMNAADVAVFPYSRVLGSGAVVLAKSFGKACIVASGSGVDEDGAFLYDPDDRGALTRALENAVGDRAGLAQTGASNRARSAEHDWQSVAEATLRTYGVR